MGQPSPPALARGLSGWGGFWSICVFAAVLLGIAWAIHCLKTSSAVEVAFLRDVALVCIATAVMTLAVPNYLDLALKAAVGLIAIIFSLGIASAIHHDKKIKATNA